MRIMDSVRWALNFQSWNPSKEDWLLACRCIQLEETQRIHRFVFQRDAKSAMGGRLLLRKAVHELLGLPYNEIRLVRSDKGKPLLAHSLPTSLPSFNVSHQGSYCVLAAEKNFNVGVDVMKVEYVGGKSTEDFFKTMTRQFTPSEWNSMKYSTDEDIQLAQFYRHWCLKESYVKAVGVGIGFDLQRLSFQTETRRLQREVITTDTKLYVDGEEAVDWLFEETMIDELHCTAVALGCPEKSVTTLRKEGKLFQEIQFSELISSAVPWQTEDESLWEVFAAKDPEPKYMRKKTVAV